MYKRQLRECKSHLSYADNRIPSQRSVIVPGARARYLAEISDTLRKYHADSLKQSYIAREIQQLSAVQNLMADRNEEIDSLLGERR